MTLPILGTFLENSILGQLHFTLPSKLIEVVTSWNKGKGLYLPIPKVHSGSVYRELYTSTNVLSYNCPQISTQNKQNQKKHEKTRQITPKILSFSKINPVGIKGENSINYTRKLLKSIIEDIRKQIKGKLRVIAKDTTKQIIE